MPPEPPGCRCAAASQQTPPCQPPSRGGGWGAHHDSLRNRRQRLRSESEQVRVGGILPRPAIRRVTVRAPGGPVEPEVGDRETTPAATVSRSGHCHADDQDICLGGDKLSRCEGRGAMRAVPTRSAARCSCRCRSDARHLPLLGGGGSGEAMGRRTAEPPDSPDCRCTATPRRTPPLVGLRPGMGENPGQQMFKPSPASELPSHGGTAAMISRVRP